MTLKNRASPNQGPVLVTHLKVTALQRGARKVPATEENSGGPRGPLGNPAKTLPGIASFPTSLADWLRTTKTEPQGWKSLLQGIFKVPLLVQCINRAPPCLQESMSLVAGGRRRRGKEVIWSGLLNFFPWWRYVPPLVIMGTPTPS